MQQVSSLGWLYLVYLVIIWIESTSQTRKVPQPSVPDPGANPISAWNRKDPWRPPVCCDLEHRPIGMGHAWFNLPRPDPKLRRSSTI
jgi:hypothetical protein